MVITCIETIQRANRFGFQCHKRLEALPAFIWPLFREFILGEGKINHDILTNSLKKDLVLGNVVVNALVVESG